VQEPDVVTTVLVGRAAWLKHHAKEARTLIQAHRELTQWIIDNPEAAQARVVEELTELTQAPMEPELVRSAWQRLKLTDAIDLAGLEQFVKDAQEAGLLDRVPPLEGMIYQQD
ncbi:MAG: aliphatic sulfonate ABC transporter substrate-binding protein, partial [Akkermansia sp.]|nr:aliphatic sulfonate ABC transporter substrate-binding protein [Akkermansia sp.]